MHQIQPTDLSQNTDADAQDSSCTIDKSDHEEADSRITLHVYYTLRKHATSILVRTVDTDVVVILVEILYCFVHRYHDLDLWVGFGAWKHFRCYHINSVCLKLGEDKFDVKRCPYSTPSLDVT